MTSLLEIRNWTHKKRISRLRELAKTAARGIDRDNSAHQELLDEAVVIMLEVFRDVLEEDPGKNSVLKWTPFDLFEAALSMQKSGGFWDMVGERFLDTKILVKRFKDGNKEEKQRLRPQLIKRGMV